MAAYIDALGKFKAMARAKFGGPADAPALEAGYAASVLRYLKDVAGGLSQPLDRSWAPIGEAVAAVPMGGVINASAAGELWTWAAEVCAEADREGLAFRTVTPNPAADHALLVKWAGGTKPGPVTSPAEVEDDELSTSWGGKPKPKPAPTTGDRVNTGLLLVAIIILATLGHRAR